MKDTQIVNAIQARIDGRFDDPDLMLVGALHDRMGDIVEILSHRGNTSPNLLSEAEVYKMTARRAIASAEQPASAEWSGSQCPVDPDGCWIDDETEEHVNAKTGERTATHPA